MKEEELVSNHTNPCHTKAFLGHFSKNTSFEFKDAALAVTLSKICDIILCFQSDIVPKHFDSIMHASKVNNSINYMRF